MTKTPISEAVKAVAAVNEIQQITSKHAEVIDQILQRLDAIERHMAHLRQSRTS